MEDRDNRNLKRLKPVGSRGPRRKTRKKIAPKTSTVYFTDEETDMEALVEREKESLMARTQVIEGNPQANGQSVSTATIDINQAPVVEVDDDALELMEVFKIASSSHESAWDRLKLKKANLEVGRFNPARSPTSGDSASEQGSRRDYIPQKLDGYVSSSGSSHLGGLGDVREHVEETGPIQSITEQASSNHNEDFGGDNRFVDTMLDEDRQSSHMNSEDEERSVWLSSDDEGRSNRDEFLRREGLLPYTIVSSDSDDAETDLPFMTAKKLEESLRNIEASHPTAPKAIMKDVWKVITEFEESIHDYLLPPVKGHRKIRSYYRSHMESRKGFPTAYLDVIIQDTTKPDHEDYYINLYGLKTFPRDRYKERKYKLLNVKAYLKLKDVMDFFRRCHPNIPMENAEAMLSGDDVPESKSSKRSLAVIALSVPCCFRRPIAVIVNISPKSNKYLTAHKLLDPLIDEVIAEKLCITHVIADKPFRAYLACQTQHNAYFTCEICPAKGFYLTESYITGDGESKKTKKMIYPTTGKETPKTHAQILQIMEEIEEGERPVGHDDNLGYTRKSPLMRLPGFDIVHGLLPDYMHLAPLGLCRKLFALSVDVDVKSIKSHHILTPRQKGFTEKYDDILTQLSTPMEFNRRPRPVDFASLKGEEWRNHFLVYAIFALDLLRNEGMRELWTCFILLLRSYCMDDQTLTHIKTSIDLEAVMQRFLELWPKILGKQHQVYNWHAFSHLPFIREQGMLTVLCTFFTEAMYYVMKCGFLPGSTSIGKQALNRVLVRWLLNHTCQKAVTFKARKEEHLDKPCADSMVYDGNNRFWVIKEKLSHDDKRCIAYPVSKSPLFLKVNGNDVNVSSVGIVTLNGIVTENEQFVTYRDLCGKVIQYGHTLVTVPRHILVESV